MANEKQIQQWLEQEICGEGLSRSISGQSLINDIVASRTDPNKIPNFTIDYLMREKCALAASYILPLLEGLELISANKNVSSEKSDTFLPDIVAYNRQQHAFVVIEIKDDKQTEREALTELLAYEHEIQNYIPLSGSFDVAYVLMSTVWSPLLQHSAAGLVTWTNKQILCLEVVQDQEPWQLQVRIPNAWTALASVDLPSDALATLTIGVKAPSASVNNDFGIPPVLKAGLELIVGEAERSNTHGFAVLCYDERPDAQFHWLITVALINPLSFFNHAESRDRFLRTTLLRSFLSTLAEQATSSQMDPRLRRLSQSAVDLISSHYPTDEIRFAEWLSTRQLLRKETVPITVEMWGALGEFARFYHSHAGVRASALQNNTDNPLNWHHPLVALPLIDDLTQNRPLLQGALTCSECFRLGVLFGTYNLVEDNLSGASESSARRLWGFQQWLDAEILIALREINYIHTASCLPRSKPPPVHLGGNSVHESLSMQPFADWMADEFIGSSYHLHQVLFKNGRYCAALFDPTLRDWLPDQELPAKTKELASIVIEMIGACRQKLHQHNQANREDILKGAAEHIQILFGSLGVPSHRDMKRAKGSIQNLNLEHLIDLFKSHVLPLCDQVFKDVFFALAPPNAAAVDWEWLRAGIKGMLDRGIDCCGVILCPNGTFGTGELPPMDCQCFGSLDHESEVFFCKWEGGYRSVHRTTWENLKNGSF